jgi:hypothetical protein
LPISDLIEEKKSTPRVHLIAEAVCASTTWRDPAIEGKLDRPAWPSLDRK